MTLSKVVRKGSYQGASQWGISTSSEITPSRKTAQKWAELENARVEKPTMKTQAKKINCTISIERMKRAVRHYRGAAYEPFTLNNWVLQFGEVYSAHFVREFCLCKDGMVRVRRLSSFGKWADSV
jgi:hypothetical protein